MYNVSVPVIGLAIRGDVFVADCEFLSSCPFFNDQMRDMPATAEIYKGRYCRGDKTLCARYMVKTGVGGEHVAQDLFPNQKERAEIIIRKNRS